jgi:hypothetical protein
MNDIIPMIIAVGLGSASAGFMAACLLLSHRMRRTNIESWREARKYYLGLYRKQVRKL